MKSPIPLPVRHVRVRHTAPDFWIADVTFGIPHSAAHDDPTLTIKSGEALESPPEIGDILMVRPPEIVGTMPGPPLPSTNAEVARTEGEKRS